GGHGFDDVSEAVGLAVDDGLSEAGSLGYIDKAREGCGASLRRDGCVQSAGNERGSQSRGCGAQQTTARPKIVGSVPRHAVHLLARKTLACFSAGSDWRQASRLDREQQSCSVRASEHGPRPLELRRIAIGSPGRRPAKSTLGR